MSKPYFHETTTLHGKVVTLEEFRAYREANPDPTTPEQRAAAERMAESYAPAFGGTRKYSKWHFNNRRAISGAP